MTAGCQPGYQQVEITSFVGREREISLGARLLLQNRLVTLVGVGGVGKTRLARRIAREACDRFADGTYCAELADLSHDDDVTDAVAAAFGVQLGSGQQPLGELVAALKDRSVLLLLDNCEHLLHSSAHTAGTLLAQLPSMRILATSRQPLDIGPEQVLQVNPLGLPEPHGHHSHAADAAAPDPRTSPAVVLFADRAKAASPGFRVTEANQQEVVAVCRKLDGLPLALEIAARRLRTLTPGELLERLDQRFHLLGPGGHDRTAHRRHHALRALFDWSYELCTPMERMAWQQLSLCSGGVLLTDAELLCAREEGSGTPEPEGRTQGPTSDDAYEALAGLVDKSLLTRVVADGHTRLQMLETVRAYGQERLGDSHRTLDALRRHRAWYLGLAAQAGAAYGTAGQASWLRRLRAEHPNLRQIFPDPPPQGEPAETVLSGALGLWLHCLTSGNVGEGARWMRNLMDWYPQPPSPAAVTVWCRAVWVAGFIFLIHGERERAEEMIVRAEQASGAAFFADRSTIREPEHRSAQVELTSALLQLRSLAALLAEEEEDTTQYALASLAIGTFHTALLTRQQCIAQLGFSAVIRGDHAGSTALLERALTLSQLQGDVWHRCYLLWGLAVDRGEAGRLDEALELLERTFRLTWEIDERLGEATLAETLAWVLASSGDAHAAAVVLGAVDRVWSPSGTPRLFGFALMSSYRERGIRYARASLGETHYASAYSTGRRLGVRHAVESAFTKGTWSDQPSVPSDPSQKVVGGRPLPVLPCAPDHESDR
ncbi:MULTISPECIES: ATP-binding protein [unclassified Streptomyces]|uniref:ATP-binding protein n=1 Tax=unclassified Streptomyces TaxID=2593676 RepID=UPI001F540B8F|nr:MULTISPECIES: AAA family ATPase [unclassified Streptomyces]